MASFPFITKNAFGLDISDTSIEALELKKKFSKQTVHAYSRVELESGVVENGRILNKPKLKEYLSKLESLATPNNFLTKDVALALPESKTFIHVFRLPSVISEENIAESIQYEAEATIPLSFDQVYHDWQIIKKGEETQDILYVACFKDVVEDFKEVLNKVGLRPVVFEAESLALARALTKISHAEPVTIVDIGARTTIVTIHDQSSIQYSNNITAGGNIFSQKISDTMGISPEEAERIKRSIGIIQEKVKEKVFANLVPIMDEIVVAVNKANDYYKKISGRQVNQIILCGGGSLTPGVREYIINALKIKTTIGDPMIGLEYPKNLFKSVSPILFSTVVGLAKRGLDDTSLKSDLNQLAGEENHHLQTANEQVDNKDNSDKKIEKKKKVKSKKTKKPLLGGKLNKRSIILISIFVILIITFVVILYLNQGGDDPMIKFQEYDLPDGPVVY